MAWPRTCPLAVRAVLMVSLLGLVDGGMPAEARAKTRSSRSRTKSSRTKSRKPVAPAAPRAADEEAFVPAQVSEPERDAAAAPLESAAPPPAVEPVVAPPPVAAVPPPAPVPAASEAPPLLQFYGMVRLDMIYDSSEMNHPQSPLFVDRQLPGTDPGGEFSMHPRLSRLGLRVNHLQEAHDLEWKAVVEVDFQNGGRESRPALRMRHAYAELSKSLFQVLFGQTWQTVSRLIPMANADTLMWAAGNTGDRAPQLRLTYRVPLGKASSITFEGAAQMMGTVHESGQAGLNFGDVPAAQGRIALAVPLWTEKPLQLALAGHYGHQELTEKFVGESSFPQQGIFAELALPITQHVSLRGEGFTGRNLSDLRGGIITGINPIRDVAIATTGFWSELVVDPAPWLSLGAGGGQDDPVDAELELGQPSLNRAFWGVVHVRPSRALRLGAEYLHWQTEFIGEQGRIAHRVNVHCQWEF